MSGKHKGFIAGTAYGVLMVSVAILVTTGGSC